MRHFQPQNQDNDEIEFNLDNNFILEFYQNLKKYLRENMWTNVAYVI